MRPDYGVYNSHDGYMKSLVRFVSPAYSMIDEVGNLEAQVHV